MSKPTPSSILDFLKTTGQCFDTDIAEALNIPLKRVRRQVENLSSSGELICCSTIRYQDGIRIEGLTCRLSCYTPPAVPGRKPGRKNKSRDGH